MKVEDESGSEDTDRVRMSGEGGMIRGDATAPHSCHLILQVRSWG